MFKGFLTHFLLSYRKKNLKKRTDEFTEALRRSMGVQCIVLAGYEVPKGFMKDKSKSGLRTV